MRKTVSIKWLLEHVNEFNASSADDMQEAREAKNMLLETVLMDAGAYNGYGYLSHNKLKGDAMSVGIREQRPDGSWNFDDTDHTRVVYFKGSGL